MLTSVTPINWYLQQLQRLIGYDEHFALYNPDDLIDFINIARDEVAAQGQCIRRETPYSSSIVSLTVTNPGSGYTNPTVTITGPDAPSARLPYPNGRQATAIVQQIGGQISSAGVIDGGDGYFQPRATITDPTGTGAELTVQTGYAMQTAVGQELYDFQDVDLSAWTGVAAIYTVRSIAIVWGNWQWTLSMCGNSKYMAVVRQFTTNFLAPPRWGSNYGQGTAGSLKMYPIPDQPYQMTWDCLLLPQEIRYPGDFDAIPQPWTKAVPYYAAHLALLSKSAQIPQFMPLALKYFNEGDGGLFHRAMTRARAFSDPGGVSSFYGRI